MSKANTLIDLLNEYTEVIFDNEVDFTSDWFGECSKGELVDIAMSAKSTYLYYLLPDGLHIKLSKPTVDMLKWCDYYLER